MAFPNNALMCIMRKVKLINHDCLPILMLMHIMLYIMLSYLTLLAVLFSAVCLYDAFLLLTFANAFFSCFVLVH